MLNALREKLKHNLSSDEAGAPSDGMDLGVVIINKQELVASYAGAYNPLLLFRNGEMTIFDADRQPIGYYRKEKSFTEKRIQLHTSDMLYMFSDGFIDQVGGPKHRKFMRKPFFELLTKINALPLPEQEQQLAATFNSWKTDQIAQTDDVLVMGIKV